MVEKLAISEGVCNHISDREAMLSKMNWSKLIIIHVRVAKTSEHYRGKWAFFLRQASSKKPNIRNPAQQFFFFFFQPAADDFQVAQFGGYSLMLATLIPGSIFPVQFSRWKLEPTSMVIILGEVSWERCINRIASLPSSLKMSSFR